MKRQFNNVKAGILLILALPVASLMLCWTLARMVWSAATMLHDTAVEAINDAMRE